MPLPNTLLVRMRQYFLSEGHREGQSGSVLESEGTVSDVHVTDFYGARENGEM